MGGPTILGDTGIVSQTDVTVFLGFLSASLITLWAVQKSKELPLRLPPGPRGLPILGILPFLGSAPYKVFSQMAEKYGRIFQVYMGGRRTIVVNGLEAAKQVLVNQSVDFAGRPDFESFKHISGGKSLAFGPHGERWKLHKKIARSALRLFTLNAANPIEEGLWREGELLIQDLLQDTGNPTEVDFPLRQAVGSVVYSLCFGAEKSPRHDQQFLEFMKSLDDFQDLVKAGGNPGDLMPSLSVFFQKKLARFINLNSRFSAFQKERFDSNFEHYDPRSLRHVGDALRKAADECPPDQMQAVGLTKQHIYSIVGDIIGAGMGTVSTALHWSILYMVKYPHVQAKVHAEIDNVLGCTLPTPSDRRRLHYTEATLIEVLRHSNSIPFLLPHATTKDTTLYEYDIPKDTLIFVNMWTVGRDPSAWKNPDDFDPERFLDESGCLDKNKTEDALIFGGGQRRCLGELLARIENFIFFVMMMQRLKFDKVPGVEYDIEGKFGLALDPQIYSYIITQR